MKNRTEQSTVFDMLQDFTHNMY